jgi:carbonic anhydrase
MFRKFFISVVVGVALFANPAQMNKITPEEALQLLKDGNTRYVNQLATHPHSDKIRLEEVSKGQKPFVTINGCSDSRVPPEILFDQGLGDVFTVRTAGNVSATDQIGTIEYGTEHLGTRLVVVLGHTKCGAVTAVAKGEHVSGSIPALVSSIVPPVNKVKSAHKNEPTEKWLNEAILANTYESIANILKKSEIVRELVLGGKVKIVAAMYDVDSGKVEFLGEHPEQLRILAQIEAKKMTEKKPKTEKKQESVKKAEEPKETKSEKFNLNH